ncbi:wall-associated receptor kinase 2-like [Eucalyptus grandis]|uniref:wall-associated receptor kinase 2-like n=1 Tax=Eucalyptus grandis TaxID=71139 RepID=UPI00192EE8BD|nr:wall-associated receptor kinase 2-like [Eucalyptus grandis]
MVFHKLLLRVVVIGAFLGRYHNHMAEAVDSMTKLGCRSTCGNLSIPYPFGLADSDPHCRIDPPSFGVICDNSKYLTFLLRTTRYDTKNNMFPISSTKNKLTAVGCNMWAFFQDLNWTSSFGCTSWCSNVSDVSNGSCLGIGCCETSIPKNSFGYGIRIANFLDHSDVVDFNPCISAFVAEIGSYNFSVGDLKQLKFNTSTLILDSAIGNQTCEDAKKNGTSYVCKNNTACTDAENGSGYKCNCLQGYRGNPYLATSCHDIDECADPENYPCRGKCHNVDGSYTCLCPKGYHGNGTKDSGDGQGCTTNSLYLMEILVGKF